VVEREMQLSEKDREIADLRMQLNNVPGPEVVEQLASVRISLNERTRELKAVASEVNMAQAQVEEYKFEADKLSKELLEMKSQMYEMTRRQSAHSGPSGEQFEATLKLKQKALQAASRKPVYTGGGFNVHSA
jgi:chromosome segregation ATPase